MKMEKVCLLIALLCPVVLSEPASNKKICSQALRSLLSHINVSFDIDNDTLTVLGFQNGSNELKTACNTNMFNVELWRAIHSPGASRPDDFGTSKYFREFQNCENPNPDLLWKHGNAIQTKLTTNSSNNHTLQFLGPVKFYHVVERQYLIRICPCTDGQNCMCDHGGSFVCSQILNVTEKEREDQVFAWCRGSKLPAPTPMIGTPTFKHCPSKVLLAGVLPSCTPVRSYDIVEVVLQPMYHGINDCKELPRDGNGGIWRRINLEPVNVTHGKFRIEIGNITHDTQYCLRVELLNHPYCNSGSDITLNRLSSICRPISLNNPIMIEDMVCGKSEPCESKPNLALIAGSSLFAALFLAIGLILYHRYSSHKRHLSREESALQRHLLQTTPLHPDIFFLYWEESPDFGEINRLVVRWLVGLGHKVLDLTDDFLQEEIMSSPECWVLEKLEDPNVKVIVVESETVSKCLQADPDATISTRTAGIDGLRLVSLRHIQARLASNYQRLGVVQYASGPRRSSVLGLVPTLVPHTRYSLPEHLAELQAWLVDTQSWDDNGNQESAREQTLRDLKAAVKRYTDANL